MASRGERRNDGGGRNVPSPHATCTTPHRTPLLCDADRRASRARSGSEHPRDRARSARRSFASSPMRATHPRRRWRHADCLVDNAVRATFAATRSELRSRLRTRSVATPARGDDRDAADAHNCDERQRADARSIKERTRIRATADDGAAHLRRLRRSRSKRTRGRPPWQPRGPRYSQTRPAPSRRPASDLAVSCAAPPPTHRPEVRTRGGACLLAPSLVSSSRTVPS